MIAGENIKPGQAVHYGSDGKVYPTDPRQVHYGWLRKVLRFFRLIKSPVVVQGVSEHDAQKGESVSIVIADCCVNRPSDHTLRFYESILAEICGRHDIPVAGVRFQEVKRKFPQIDSVESDPWWKKKSWQFPHKPTSVEFTRESKAEKPPLGLMPQKIHLELRRDEIQAAIDRYIDAGSIIPREWTDELLSIDIRLRCLALVFS